MHLARAGLGALLAVILLAPGMPLADAQDPSRTGILLAGGTVVTMDEARAVLEEASVLVRGGVIEAVWQGEPPAGVELDGVQILPLAADEAVYPGLINLHGHPLYHFLPTWAPPSTHAQPDKGRPTGAEPYANRYQWNAAGSALPEQRRLVGAPANVVAYNLSLEREVLKYAEAMSALGGQTMYQGQVGEHDDVDFTLVRNIDWGAFCTYERKDDCVDETFSRVASIDQMAMFGNDHQATWFGMASGETQSWFVHLAEGVRDSERPAGDPNSSRAEMDALIQRGLLTEKTIVIHGNGLEARDYQLMRAAPPLGANGVVDGLGARLVWSPTSNLLLYGKTAHVYDAKRAGVLVSLGTDWTPSGTRNLLGELKVADIALRDPRILGDERIAGELPAALLHPTPQSEIELDLWLVEMVTRNPALAIDEHDRIGSLEPGKLADLVVVKRPALSPTNGMPDSPYRRIIDATERDVRLVLIGGVPVAGDVDVMTALKPGDFETIVSPHGGYAKAIDITTPGIPGADQTLADVTASLQEALASFAGDTPVPGGGPSPPTNTWKHLRENMDGGRYADWTDAQFLPIVRQRFGSVAGGGVNVEAIQLNPLLAEDDDWLFALLDASVDATPPYGAYAHNHNHVGDAGNPLASEAFEARWYG